MAKLDPRMLKSYMDHVKASDSYDDDEYENEDDVESEGGEDYIEEGAEELAEQLDGGDYEGFMKLLFENATAIQAAASHITMTVMDEELPESAKEDLEVALEGLPEELVTGIKQHFAGMDLDQLHEVVESLEEAGAIENDASVVPFLYWAARLA